MAWLIKFLTWQNVAAENGESFDETETDADLQAVRLLLRIEMLMTQIILPQLYYFVLHQLLDAASQNNVSQIQLLTSRDNIDINITDEVLCAVNELHLPVIVFAPMHCLFSISIGIHIYFLVIVNDL